MSGNTEFSLLWTLKQLKDRWFRKVLIRTNGTGIKCAVFRGGIWDDCDIESTGQSVFEQRVFLVPDSLCFFRLREFPADVVSRQALKEAIELDLARWSPVTEDASFYFWPLRQGEQWKVAVWVWQKSELAKTLEALPIAPSFIMPELAWKLSSIQDAGGEFLLLKKEGSGWNYTAVLNNRGRISSGLVNNGNEAQRFKASLGETPEHLPVYLDESVDFVEVPWEAEERTSPAVYQLPGQSSLDDARQSGVEDWSDPFVWLKPVGALLALYILWLFSSGLVALKHAEEIASFSQQAAGVSDEVLEARADVERLNKVMYRLDELREDQSRSLVLMAAVSEKLPKEAWLEHFEYRGGSWLELTGKSDQSAVLAAVLEELPEVEAAVFLNDLRRDPRTGLEPFKLRIKIAGGRE